MTVSDGPRTATSNFTVKVQDVNEPHTIVGLPARVELDAEATVADTLVSFHILSFIL